MFLPTAKGLQMNVISYAGQKFPAFDPKYWADISSLMKFNASKQHL